MEHRQGRRLETLPETGLPAQSGLSQAARRRWILPAVWALFCWILLCFPVDQAKQAASPSVAAWRTPSLLEAAIHGFLFFTLAALLFRSGVLRGRRAGWAGGAVNAGASALVSTLYGAATEAFQILLPQRSAQWDDVAANALGAALFAMLAVLLGLSRVRSPTSFPERPPAA